MPAVLIGVALLYFISPEALFQAAFYANVLIAEVIKKELQNHLGLKFTCFYTLPMRML